MYQWGRGNDGHQCRTSSTFTSLSSSDQPGHNEFIVSNENPFNWRSPQNVNLWQGINGINNPCPTGFRVPTKSEFLQEINSWEIENMNGGFNSKISKLKFTLNGYRAPGNITGLSAGEIYYTPTIGHYWTSTVSPTSEINKDFIYRSEYVSIDGSGVASSSSLRSSGRAIRCIKD